VHRKCKKQWSIQEQQQKGEEEEDSGADFMSEDEEQKLEAGKEKEEEENDSSAEFMSEDEVVHKRHKMDSKLTTPKVCFAWQKTIA
jgi:hypothetical protein